MLCAGSVYIKNVKNIMLKNLLDGKAHRRYNPICEYIKRGLTLYPKCVACCGAIGFWSIRFALEYGDKVGDSSQTLFIRNAGFFLDDFTTG